MSRSAVAAVPTAVLLLSAGFSGSPARALEPASLASLEARALAESPELAAARARVEATRSRAAAAGVFDDPRLMLEGRRLLPIDDGGRAEAMLVLEQPLPGYGQRGAARDVAAAEVALAEVELGRAEQRLLAGVRTDWAEIYRYDQELRALGEAHELLDLLVATVSTLYGAGQEGAAAAIQAQLELSFHELDLEAAQAELTATLARLSSRIGATEPLGYQRIDSLPAVSLPKIDPQTAAPSALDAAVAARRVALAEVRLAAARAERSLDWAVGGGVIVEEGRNPNLVARVGVELPFFRSKRIEPAIAAAESELAAAREDERRAVLEARAELARWLAEGRRQDISVRRLAEGVVPQSSAALEAARIEFLNDRAPFSETLMRFKDWYHARLDLARAQAARYAAWAEIEALLASPVPAPPAGGSR